MIRCGHCKEYHDTVAQVRLCSHRKAVDTTDELRAIQDDLEQELQEPKPWPGYYQACGAPDNGCPNGVQP